MTPNWYSKGRNDSKKDKKTKNRTKKLAEFKIISIFAFRNDTYLILNNIDSNNLVYEKTTQESARFGLRCA